jgi:hypothetical protein
MEANPLYGRPWQTDGRYENFEGADKRRKFLSSEKNLQVKVKKLLGGYIVKVRSTILEPTKPKRISRKKQRKEKTNDR